MKYCTSCGKTLNDAAKFCTRCGAKCDDDIGEIIQPIQEPMAVKTGDIRGEESPAQSGSGTQAVSQPENIAEEKPVRQEEIPQAAAPVPEEEIPAPQAEAPAPEAKAPATQAAAFVPQAEPKRQDSPDNGVKRSENTAYCGQCGGQLTENAKFCPGCGASVVRITPKIPVCKKCGEQLTEGARFCTNCGTPCEAPRKEAAAAAGVDRNRYSPPAGSGGYDKDILCPESGRPCRILEEYKNGKAGIGVQTKQSGPSGVQTKQTVSSVSTVSKKSNRYIALIVMTAILILDVILVPMINLLHGLIPDFQDGTIAAVAIWERITGYGIAAFRDIDVVLAMAALIPAVCVLLGAFLKRKGMCAFFSLIASGLLAFLLWVMISQVGTAYVFGKDCMVSIGFWIAWILHIVSFFFALSIPKSRA